MRTNNSHKNFNKSTFSNKSGMGVNCPCGF